MNNKLANLQKLRDALYAVENASEEVEKDWKIYMMHIRNAIAFNYDFVIKLIAMIVNEESAE